LIELVFWRILREREAARLYCRRWATFAAKFFPKEQRDWFRRSLFSALSSFTLGPLVGGCYITDNYNAGPGSFQFSIYLGWSRRFVRDLPAQSWRSEARQELRSSARHRPSDEVGLGSLRYVLEKASRMTGLAGVAITVLPFSRSAYLARDNSMGAVAAQQSAGGRFQ